MVVLVGVMADPNAPYGYQQQYTRPAYKHEEHEPVYNKYQPAAYNPESRYSKPSYDDEPGPIATLEELEKVRSKLYNLKLIKR